jgi:hypothetical protein
MKKRSAHSQHMWHTLLAGFCGHQDNMHGNSSFIYVLLFRT